MKKDPVATRLTDLKARMICYGVAVDQGTADYLEQAGVIDRGFIQGTVLLVNRTDPVNTSLLDGAYSDDDRAPRLLSMDNGELYIQCGSGSLSVSVLPSAPFASEPFADSVIGGYLRLHNLDTLFATPVRQCAYIAANRPCLFCTFEGGRVRRLSVDQMCQLVAMYRSWRPSIGAIAFGGGSPNLSDFGAKYYAGLVEGLRAEHDLGISVEIVPARRASDWDVLLRSGVGAIISSIEIWDDEVRRQICLGKSELSKDLYRERWREAIAVLGAGRVSSVLLVGLEPIESTLAGARALIADGIIPTLIPYRPYDASPLGRLAPVDHEVYVRLSSTVASELVSHGLDPSLQPGCTACGACSLEREFYATSIGIGRPLPTAMT